MISSSEWCTVRASYTIIRSGPPLECPGPHLGTPTSSQSSQLRPLCWDQQRKPFRSRYGTFMCLTRWHVLRSRLAEPAHQPRLAMGHARTAMRVCQSRAISRSWRVVTSWRACSFRSPRGPRSPNHPLQPKQFGCCGAGSDPRVDLQWIPRSPTSCPASR